MTFGIRAEQSTRLIEMRVIANACEDIERLSLRGRGVLNAIRRDQWQARIDLQHAASQHRVPDNESGTAGYTTVGASAGYHFDIGASQWLAFVKGENLTNQTVRYASSILRDIAPAQGRSVEVGLRTTF